MPRPPPQTPPSQGGENTVACRLPSLAKGGEQVHAIRLKTALTPSNRRGRFWSGTLSRGGCGRQRLGRRLAIETGVCPDDPVSGVLASTEIHIQPQLFGPIDRKFE